MRAVRQAVIDIGSNTIRLVVYAGWPRAPLPIYNEKSRVKLGACLAGNGEIDKTTMKKALAALARFETLARTMQVNSLRVVATAATREAKNGHELVEKAAALGINVEVLDGDAEATAAGYGVLSDNPLANGYVGDLGGGSLELIRISDGKLGARVSLPLGTLRHDILTGKSPKQITQMLRNDIAKTMGKRAFPMETGLPFYMIGGSWRSFARLHMHATGYPLTILSNYEMLPEVPETLAPLVQDRDALIQSNVVAAGRIAELPGAAALLGGIVGLLKPRATETGRAKARPIDCLGAF
jgi:exopolyphosphatase/guanosine-5'-triphosphate,3'-diphosphate pyrophosphatase